MGDPLAAQDISAHLRAAALTPAAKIKAGAVVAKYLARHCAKRGSLSLLALRRRRRKTRAATAIKKIHPSAKSRIRRSGPNASIADSKYHAGTAIVVPFAANSPKALFL